MKFFLVLTLIIAASEGRIIIKSFPLFVQHLLLLKGKVFERCEFARELVNNQGFARATVGNWVCLANVRFEEETSLTVNIDEPWNYIDN